MTTAAVTTELNGQEADNGDNNNGTSGVAMPPDLSGVPSASPGTGFDVSVQSAVIVWDPTARDRPGEAGQIQYVGVDGIGTEMRGLTTSELADPFINAAVNMNSESKLYQDKKAEAAPTDLSGGTNSASPFEGNTTIEASRFIVVVMFQQC